MKKYEKLTTEIGTVVVATLDKWKSQLEAFASIVKLMKGNNPLMVEDADQEERDNLLKREIVKDKKGRCINKFVDLFANTALPLNTADNPFFIDLLKELDPDIKFPGRKATTSLLVQGRFVSMYTKMKSVMAMCTTLHCTTDMWSNSHCRSAYIGFTIHCYDPVDRVRRSFRLALREFNQAHTAENIVNKSVDIFKEFGIKHKASFSLSINIFSHLFYTNYLNCRSAS